MFGTQKHHQDKRQHNELDYAVLRKNGVLPLHKARYNKMTTTPLTSFATSSRGLLHKEIELPWVRTSDGFDQNAHKLMKKYGYDFSKLLE